MFYFTIDKLRLLDNGRVKSSPGIFGDWRAVPVNPTP